MTLSLENARLSKTNWLITMYAGGGEFCDGYILSIIGVALPLITATFALSAAGAGILGSASLVGMFVGGLTFGYVTDRVGRQKVYLADIAAFIVLSALQFFAQEPWQLVVLRFGMGIAIGADFAIASTIASEFAPQKARGPLLVVMVTMWSVGAAAAYIVGWAMLSLGPDGWRWMLASSVVPAALILFLRIGTPESPRWLLSKGRTDEAQAVLVQMLGPDADITDIAADTGSRTRYRDIFRGVYLKRTVFVCLFWACQLLPIYAINTYEPTILGSFGLGTGNATYLGAVIIQIFFVLGSLSGALFVNRGRRTLLLWSFAISACRCWGWRCCLGLQRSSWFCCSRCSGWPPSPASACRRSTRRSCSRPGSAPPRTVSRPESAASAQRSAPSGRHCYWRTACGSRCWWAR